MNYLIERAIKNYRIVGICLLILTIPFGYFYAQKKFFTHVSIFFDHDDPAILYYQQFQKQFGNDEMAAVIFKDKDIFTPENIAIIREISEFAKSMNQIERVMSLTEVEIARSNKDSVGIDNLISEGSELTPENLSSIRDISLSNPLIRDNMISKDGTTTAILILLKPISSNEIKRDILNTIREKAEAIAGKHITLHYAGGPFLEEELEALTHKDNARFTPLTLGVITFVVFLFVRNFTLTLLSQMTVIIIILWSIGLMIMRGESINTVTVIIAPLLLAISIQDTIHILSHYKKSYQNNGRQHEKAIIQTIKSLWVPCLATSLTTAVAYLSFITATVKPVRTVGIYTSIGVMIAYLMTIFFLPTLLMFSKKWIEKNIEKGPVPTSGNRDSRILRFITVNLGETVVRYNKLILLVFLIFSVVAVYGTSRLRFETDFVRYLKDGNPIKNDILFIEENIRGTIPVEVVFHASSPEFDFTHPENLKLLETIQQMVLQKMDGRFTTSISVSDYIKEINQALNGGDKTAKVIPESRMDVLDYMEIGDRAMLSKLVSPDYMEARISFAARFSSTEQSRIFQEYLKNHVEPLLKDRLTYVCTGLSALYVTMDENIRESQLRSFGSAFFVIFFMMYFVCRGFKLTLISMIPNLFPILTTLGIMGWFNLPLDGSTIMIASVSIGLAVDDTIHFITWFRRNILSGMNTREAVLKTFKDTGEAIAMTSVVLCSSYMVLLSGSIVPVVIFGLLAGLAMLFALLGDLFILPALLLLFEPAVQGQSEITAKEGHTSHLNKTILIPKSDGGEFS